MTTSSAPPPSDGRRLDLDGLRGLAVLLVVGFHAGIPWLRGAFVAVDVFFVLSGFFLGTALLKRLATDEELRPFEVVTRRIWRILPALVVVLLATLAMTLLYAPIDRATVAGRVVPVAAFAGNLAFAADGVNYFHAGENPLLHTWTLGVELQLALLFPLLLAGCAALGRARAPRDATESDRRWIVMRTVLIGVVAAGAVSFALSVATNESNPMWAYFGPHTRLWSFCAGALMAFLAGGGRSLVGGSSGKLGALQGVGLALLFLPALLYQHTWSYPGVIALAPVGGTLCLLAAGSAGAASLPGRILAASPLVAVGRVSYGWYLWHLPLMVLGSVLIPDLSPGGRFVFGAAGLGAAWLTHRLLLRPGAAGLVSRLQNGRPLVTAALVSGALVLLAVVAGRISARHVEHSVHRRYAAARQDHVDHGCWGREAHPDAEESCAFGTEGAGPTLALLGDSHASHWIGGLERAGANHGWRIEAHVMGACPVADLRFQIPGAAGYAYRRCAEFREGVIRRLEATRPHAVILSNADYYMEREPGKESELRIPEAAWTDGLRRTYQRLDRAGIGVIVLRDVPWVPFDVPSCLSRRAARLPMATSCDFTLDQAFMARAHRAQENAARGLRVRFIDMNDQVCPSARCASERGGVILYTDDNHITASFSRTLAPVLGERLESALRP